MGKPIKKTDLNKPWMRKKKTKKQSVNAIPKRKTFLIVCEGVNTEPEYFKSFPVATASVKSFGLGASKTALVKQIIDIAKKENDTDLEVWCVFDMDVKYDEAIQQKEDFNRAIELAHQHGFQVAYSNDCFELWLVLHFQLIQGKMHRSQYYEMLSNYFNVNYEKEGKKIEFSRSIYDLLANNDSANQQQALEFARKLHENCQDEIFSNRNPCTTIYNLVCELNKNIKGHTLAKICNEPKLT